MDVFSFGDHFFYGPLYVTALFIIYESLFIKLEPVKRLRLYFIKCQSKDTSLIIKGLILLLITNITVISTMFIANESIRFLVAYLIGVFLIETVLMREKK